MCGWHVRYLWKTGIRPTRPWSSSPRTKLVRTNEGELREVVIKSEMLSKSSNFYSGKCAHESDTLGLPLAVQVFSVTWRPKIRITYDFFAGETHKNIKCVHMDKSKNVYWEDYTNGFRSSEFKSPPDPNPPSGNKLYRKSFSYQRTTATCTWGLCWFSSSWDSAPQRCE